MSTFAAILSAFGITDISSHVIPEDILKKIAEKLLMSGISIDNVTDNLFSILISPGGDKKTTDWNVGSIIQHLPFEAISDSISRHQKTGKIKFLQNSIGINWALGEILNFDPVIVNFLNDTVCSASNSEAWWKAAFSLEKLGVDNAISLLKRNVKSYDGSPPHDISHYIAKIEDKKSVICLLLLSTTDNAQKRLYPELRKKYLDTNPNETLSLINSAWLLARLHLIDDEILAKMIEQIERATDYELKYYLFSALQEYATDTYASALMKFTRSDDPLIRRMAIRGLAARLVM